MLPSYSVNYHSLSPCLKRYVILSHSYVPKASALFMHCWKPRKFIVCWLIFLSAFTKHLLNAHVLVRKVSYLYLRSTVDFCVHCKWKMQSLIDTFWNFTFLELCFVLYTCEKDQLDAHFFLINLLQLYCPLRVSN